MMSRADDTQPLLGNQAALRQPPARSELPLSTESRYVRFKHQLTRFTKFFTQHSLEIFHGSTVLSWASSIILALFHHEDIADEDTRQRIQRAFSVGLTAITGNQ